MDGASLECNCVLKEVEVHLILYLSLFTSYRGSICNGSLLAFPTAALHADPACSQVTKVHLCISTDTHVCSYLLLHTHITKPCPMKTICTYIHIQTGVQRVNFRIWLYICMRQWEPWTQVIWLKSPQHTSLHTPETAFSSSLGIPQFLMGDRTVVSETSWAVWATKLCSHHQTRQTRTNNLLNNLQQHISIFACFVCVYFFLGQDGL